MDNLYEFYSVLGVLSALFILLSMSRGIVTLLLPVIIAQNKAQGKTKSLSLSVLKTLTKSHGLFGVLALLLGIAHGALMFLTNTMASLTGGTLIVLLLVQGVLGVLQSRRIGNVKLWQELHEKIPYALILVLIAHIVLNNFGY
jgi:hypothetical protein